LFIADLKYIVGTGKYAAQYACQRLLPYLKGDGAGIIENGGGDSEGKPCLFFYEPDDLAQTGFRNFKGDLYRIAILKVSEVRERMSGMGQMGK
jgi:hypothetical protein